MAASKDQVFNYLLQKKCLTMGRYECPVVLNQQNIKHGFLDGNLPIMRTLLSWLSDAADNRMVVFTDKYGKAWSVMNIVLNGQRIIDWVNVSIPPPEFLQYRGNPVWITAYMDS